MWSSRCAVCLLVAAGAALGPSGPLGGTAHASPASAGPSVSATPSGTPSPAATPPLPSGAGSSPPSSAKSVGPSEPRERPAPAGIRRGRQVSLFSGWRAALRIARRDAVRAKGRSALVVAMIALPVLGVTAADLTYRSALPTLAEELTADLGAADALFTDQGMGPVRLEQMPDGIMWQTPEDAPETFPDDERKPVDVPATFPKGSRHLTEQLYPPP
ncbi:hypothetical protein SMICM17S_02708 [Streptomyces microflavus]